MKTHSKSCFRDRGNRPAIDDCDDGDDDDLGQLVVPGYLGLHPCFDIL